MFSGGSKENIGNEKVTIDYDLSSFLKPFHDGGRYHIETSPLICGANQWTGFYMISASVMKGLKS